MQLDYGADSPLEIELPAGTVAAYYGQPSGAVIADRQAVLRAALEQPQGGVPLAALSVPGDRIVVALGKRVSHADVVVAALVEQLLSADDGRRLTIVQEGDAPRPEQALLGRLDAQHRSAVDLVTHAPRTRRELSYLAASRTGRPILLHRAICEADVLIVVETTEPGHALGTVDGLATIYPGLADYKAQRRLRRALLAHHDEGPLRRAARRRPIDRVAWLLGDPLTVRVVPGGGDEWLDVVAGPASVAVDQASARAASLWPAAEGAPASMVVAAVSGGATEQTWENLGRALATAMRLVEHRGTIALCTSLAAAPGPAVRRLARSNDSQAALRQIERRLPVDTAVARELVRAVDEADVYLLSQLDDELVEGLGLVPVASHDELRRLIRPHPSCAVVANAQRAIVQLVDT